jgi:hypothetical protein
MVVGISGFLTVGKNLPDLIVYRNKIEGYNDLAMIIARLLIAVNLMLSAPANYNAFRLSILELVWKTNEISNSR